MPQKPVIHLLNQRCLDFDMFLLLLWVASQSTKDSIYPENLHPFIQCCQMVLVCISVGKGICEDDITSGSHGTKEEHSNDKKTAKINKSVKEKTQTHADTVCGTSC
jgi:hypothetical protein